MDPLHEYPHGPGCAVIGGVVVRSAEITGLEGAYIYGDYCERSLRALVPDGVGGWDPVVVSTTPDAVLSVGPQVGADVLVLALDGVYRLVDAG